MNHARTRSCAGIFAKKMLWNEVSTYMTDSVSGMEV
jgi:hypothetical protein